MNRIVIVCEQEYKEQYKALLGMLETLVEKEGYDILEVFIKDGDITFDIADKLRAEEVKYIFSIDMAGFEMKTLLEEPLYNIVLAKQLHIIVDCNWIAEYREEVFALNLYFGLPSDSDAEKQIDALNILKYSVFETDENGFVLESEKNYSELELLYSSFLKDVEGDRKR